jgi:hypothetical protein
VWRRDFDHNGGGGVSYSLQRRVVDSELRTAPGVWRNAGMRKDRGVGGWTHSLEGRVVVVVVSGEEALLHCLLASCLALSSLHPKNDTPSKATDNKQHHQQSVAGVMSAQGSQCSN